MKIALFEGSVANFKYILVLAHGVHGKEYTRISEWKDVEFTMLPKDKIKPKVSKSQEKDNEIQRLTGISDRLRGYDARSKNEWYLQGYSEQIELEAVKDARTYNVEF